MIFSSASYTDNGVRCVFQNAQMQNIRYDFRRTVIGVSYPEASEQRMGTGYGFAVVVGERCYYHDNPAKLPERVYVVLEDAEDVQSVPLFDKLIPLKDRYLCSTVFCLPSPVSVYEALRRHDGLSFYSEQNPLSIQDQFRSFVSRSVVAGIRALKDDTASMQRDLEAVMAAYAVDPNTRQTMRFQDGTHQPLPRLVIPKDLLAQETQKGIEIGTDEIRRALWLAVKGMELSPRWQPRRLGVELVQDKGITGY